MSKEDFNYMGLAAKYLDSNLHRLECSTGCFVCLACEVGEHRGTWNPDQFLGHLSEAHASLETLSCIFCGLEWPRLYFTVHIASHFSIDVSHPLPYSCPHSSCSLRTDSLKCLQLHLIAKHNEKEHEGSYSCPHCVNQQKTHTSWLEHLQENSFRLSHCMAEGCFVKSPSKKLIIKHILKKHCANKATCMLLVRETVEFFCGNHGSVPSFLRSFLSSPPIKCISPSSSPLPVQCSFQRPHSPSSTNNRISTKKGDTPTPLCLRCPHCTLATANWTIFVEHSRKCPSVVFSASSTSSDEFDSAEGVYSCNLYWCSLCSTVSTEKSLVLEHANSSHLSHSATVVHEVYETTSSHLNAVQTKLKAKTSAVFTPPLSSLDVFSAFSKLLPQTSLFSKPFTSKGTLVNSLPSTILNSSETKLVALKSSPSLSADAPQSLFSSVPPCSGLANPFLNSNFADPSNLFGPDAASAVAAMAAALSGLTGMNVPPLASQPESSTNKDNRKSPARERISKKHSRKEEDEDLTPGNNAGVAVDYTGRDDSTTVAEDGLSMIPAGSGTGGEELVSFPFDEVVFRNEMTSRLDQDVLDSLISKMQRFSGYLVKILGKENHRRIPVCPECEKVFNYGLGDFKRHLLTIHLEVPREHLKNCLKFTRLPKGEEKFQEAQEQLVMRQMKPSEIRPGERRIPLPYSFNLLNRLTEHLSSHSRDYLFTKMRLYSRLAVILDTSGELKKYKCYHCNYSSPHALADVRKHILGSHCGISTKHFRFCLQASRLDPVEFCLLSDDRLTRLARDFLSRRQSDGPGGDSGTEKTNSRSSSPTLPPVPVVTNGKVRKSSNVNRSPDENGVSRFTTTIPGSKNPVKVCIRAPVPPTSCSPTPPPPPLSHPITSPTAQPTSFMSDNIPPLDLEYLSKITGLEDADEILPLPLPYSESVLLQLLETAGAKSQHVEDVSKKMAVYSTYEMTRICSGDRTLAFRCPCGRVFVTTRQPDSKMRAATLADSRRHVMGVHARIPHEYITICCQASRISRENNFQLYPDDMLLRLAMDRPIKLTTASGSSKIIATTTVTTSGGSLRASRSSSSKSSALPPLRPLNEIVSRSDDMMTGSPQSGIDDDDSSRLDVSHREHSFNTSNGFEDLEEDCDYDDQEVEPINTEETQRYLNNTPATDVERVIDLPYSKEALRALVNGYCPQSFFCMLINKMELYTNFKVFITRRKGRRFFCCSGCMSSSPHGMGDIRKHILGVHAKVPERYKAAAMHCSRLSREDNSLLPDRSLLQLAKMKWKGTVIKPLAEINMLNFGNRRASALGLSSSKAGSAGRNSLSPRLSAHNASAIAAPFHLNSTLLETGEMQYSCSCCGTNSLDVAAMRAHVVREHLLVDPHACPKCHKGFSSVMEVQQHLIDVHADCPRDVASLAMSEAFQNAMSLINIKEFSEATSATVFPSNDDQSVSSEDVELGRLWSINCPDVAHTTSSAADDSPPSSNGFPSTPVPTPENGTSTPTSSSNGRGGGDGSGSKSGSSRRKPSKSHLIQFKPKQEPRDADEAEDFDGEELEAKRPRLSENSSNSFTFDAAKTAV